MSNGKIVVVGAGEHLSPNILRKMKELDVEVVDVNQENPFVSSIIEYKMRPQMITPEKSKPTCDRHHEYVVSGKEEIGPNMYREIWACRFCKKEL